MNLFKNGPPFRLHIGLRMVKTAVAVFICAIIGYWRGQVPFYSMIAAVICMQASTDESFMMAIDRTIATLIGGLIGLGVLLLLQAIPVQALTPLYYLVVCIMLIPVILVTVLIKKPSITYLTCVVFLSVTVTHISNETPAAFAFQRVADTLIGIAVALVINLVIPGGRPKTETGGTEENPDREEPEAVEEVQVPEPPGSDGPSDEPR